MDSPSLCCVAWSKADSLGAEFAEVRVDGDVLAARGVAIGNAPFPYRLDYELETTSAFVTSRLIVTARGNGCIRSLDLRRAISGAWEETWSEDGENPLLPRRTATDLGVLADALDVDLGLSPPFNTTASASARLGPTRGKHRFRDGLGLGSRPFRAPIASALHLPADGRPQEQPRALRVVGWGWLQS